jgi:hypothetical protein
MRFGLVILLLRGRQGVVELYAWHDVKISTQILVFKVRKFVLFEYGLSVPRFASRSAIVSVRLIDQEVAMAASPAEIPKPYTYEEALVNFLRNLSLIVVALSKCPEIEADDTNGPIRDGCFLPSIHSIPPHRSIQHVQRLLTRTDDSSKEKSTFSGAVAAMIFALPASVFFGYKSVNSVAYYRFGAVWLLLAVGVYV